MKHGTKIFILIFVLVISGSVFTARLYRSCYNPTTISIYITNGQADIYQIYYDAGFGYNEKESVRRYFSGPGSYKVDFLVPCSRFNKFRIDPGTKKGTMKIDQICVLHGNSRKCWIGHALISNFLFQHDIINHHTDATGLIITSTGSDPFFEYKGNLVKDIEFLPDYNKVWAEVAGLLLLNILVWCLLVLSDKIYRKIQTLPNPLINIKILKPQEVFVSFAIVFGILTVLITPPFQGPDEPAHFFRVYQLASGTFFPVTNSNRVGGYIPISLVKTHEIFKGIQFHPEKKNRI